VNLSAQVIINLVKGDQNIPVDFTITDASSNAVDLSNTSANFKMSAPGSLIDKTNAGCVHLSATGGMTTYTFQARDLDTAGSYIGEIELKYYTGNYSGRDVTVTGIVVDVGPEAPE
jgi:hypothetical protein